MTGSTSTATSKSSKATPREGSEIAFYGRPASRGRITGRVRVVRSEADVSLAKAGDIIVCVAAPASVWQRAGIAGIIAETGGALSSAATIARERGIPMVAGAAEAMSRVGDGQTVVMDGGTGLVTTG